MATTLKVRDETSTGETVHELSLEFLTENITVRDLIRERVYQEVKDYNTKQPEVIRSLVQPAETARVLNGFKLKKKRQIDWEKQFDLAVQGFEGNQVIVLVDNRQAEALEEEIVLTPKTDIAFLRLVPLVGG
jgi:hypothetical protein